MKRFRVDLNTLAHVDATVHVEAKNEKEAKEAALKMAQGGDVVWAYNGTVDGAEIFVEECEQENED